MCVAFLMVDICPGFPLAVLINRDEFYARPSLPAHRWPGAGAFAAGKDVVSGGTWAGMAAGGRFALLTNFRDFEGHRDGAKSRGGLVTSFLESAMSPHAFIEKLRAHRTEYNDFNIVLGAKSQVFYYSSSANEMQELHGGLYGLANKHLDLPWPKVVRGKELLAPLLKADRVHEEELLDVMLDRQRPQDDLLPRETAVGIDLERELSSIFVRTEIYGTCSSTLMLHDKAGRSTLVERTFVPEETGFRTTRLSLASP